MSMWSFGALPYPLGARLAPPAVGAREPGVSPGQVGEEGIYYQAEEDKAFRFCGSLPDFLLPKWGNMYIKRTVAEMYSSQY